MIRAAREAKQLSARQLASETGLHHTAITALERGEYAQPRPANLMTLARALELDSTDVMTLAGYQPTDKLPGFGVYLRTATALPDDAIEELRGHYEYLQSKYGVSDTGPTNGEDEADD